MGDHHVQFPSGLHLNGLLPDEVESVTRVLDAERWALAERRTAELIATIQPNPPSEQRRNAVANYVQRLITKCFSCQVCTFGSVPLKTYLPDGDIDLTAVTSNTNLKDTWASELRNILENEERSENAEFRVKEVQYIQAEVKIVKCLVENIVVDISLNQVGGLCTLCFLEEIDHLINQNHLFKRSIILIKAWCYYESRILGAHHGLISTYALETLVLYIFHVFNNSFAGPLEVLYRFLEFFSNFDWENFCISLWGPVPISSLPDMTAEPPRKDGGKLLLEKPFLDACTTVYAVPGGQENQGQPFVSKHFNVIDPLRTNNNLGRSVSKGNFFRIRSAFGFGAKKLARLLECPKESLIDEVNLFFMNTWERHGSGHRPDAPNSNLWHLQPLESLSVEESNTSRMAAHIPQVINIINQHSQSAYKTSNPSNISRAHSQRSYGSRSSDQPDKSQKTLKPDHSISVQFARTQSSPELTDSSRRSSALESGRPQYSHARSDFYGGSRRKNLSSEVSGHGAKSSFDELSSISHSSSHQSLEGSTNHDDIAFQSMREELPSVSEALEIQQDMQQEEQDLVNMMATRLHTFNGQLQLPMHLASHLPLPLSPVLASMGYGQRNLTGMVPSNIALIDSSWGHGGIQFPQGFASPSLSPYFPSSASLSSNVEESIEPGNETSEESIHGLWHEHDSGSSRGFNSDNGVPDLHSDDNGGFSNFVPSSRGSSPSVSYIQGQQKRENHMEALPNSRFVPVSQASSSRSKSFSESSKDWSSQRGSKSSRDKWGRKPPFVSVVTSMHGRSNSSGHISPQEDDDSKDWVPISTMSTDIVDRNPGPDSMILSSPVIVGNSHQRMDNSGVVPVAFYPTGPPVPFLTMLPIPLCNYQPDAGTPASSSSHFHEDEGEDDNCIRELDQNFDSAENLEPSEAHMSFAASTSRSGASESSNEPKTDILHSDFASHWQNLQLGRFCQTSSNHGPFMYSSPMMVPPTYLHGHVPWEGPGRPNLNMFTQIAGYGPRLIPVQPLQSGPNRPATVFQQYGDEPPRFRSGTGTYLPNPVPFRDRQFPSTRNHRGNYNYDRGDHGDREGSWISTKARAASRIHGRNQSEKPSARIDRYASTDKRSDKPWDSYRQENNTSHQSRGNSFGPSNSAHGSADMPYGVYQMPSASSNGVGPSGPGVPSVVMLYPYDQGVSYSSSSESLEFGTLGSMQLPDASEVPHSSEGNLGRVHEQRHGTYSARSSPDQPSSLHTQRGC